MAFKDDRRQSVRREPESPMSSSMRHPELDGVMYRSARHVLDEYAIGRARLDNHEAQIAFDRTTVHTALEAVAAIQLILEHRLHEAHQSLRQ